MKLSCETEINECDSNPCFDNGVNTPTCVNLVNSFKCNCASGFTGVLCEKDINECASNPCLNNGNFSPFYF
jgi:hypothetical protein